MMAVVLTVQSTLKYYLVTNPQLIHHISIY